MILFSDAGFFFFHFWERFENSFFLQEKICLKKEKGTKVYYY